MENIKNLSNEELDGVVGGSFEMSKDEAMDILKGIMAAGKATGNFVFVKDGFQYKISNVNKKFSLGDQHSAVLSAIRDLHDSCKRNTQYIKNGGFYGGCFGERIDEFNIYIEVSCKIVS